MDRRGYLHLAATVGCAGLAGCGGLGGPTALSEPTTESDPGERRLTWRAGEQELCTFELSGRYPESGELYLWTNITHPEGTLLDTLRLRIRVPGEVADVALLTPVEGDSAIAPSMTLGSTDGGLGTELVIEEFGELADDDLMALEFLVVYGEGATELTVETVIDLSERGLFGDSYRLSGEPSLPFPNRDDAS